MLFVIFLLDSFKSPQRSIDKPFRLCVSDVFKGKHFLFIGYHLRTDALRLLFSRVWHDCSSASTLLCLRQTSNSPKLKPVTFCNFPSHSECTVISDCSLWLTSPILSLLYLLCKFLTVFPFCRECLHFSQLPWFGCRNTVMSLLYSQLVLGFFS